MDQNNVSVLPSHQPPISSVENQKIIDHKPTPQQQQQQQRMVIQNTNRHSSQEHHVRTGNEQNRRQHLKRRKYRQKRATKMNDRDHPLLQFSIDQFPTLQKIILEQQSWLSSSASSSMSSTSSSPTIHMMIGLYFAASWCPMSTPTTQLLDDTFRQYLLVQQQQQHQIQKVIPETEGMKKSSVTAVRKTTLKSPPSSLPQQQPQQFRIVYVSSDETMESFQSYLRPGWDYIPYHDPLEKENHNKHPIWNERDRIKQFFHTCAKREIERIFTNPTSEHDHIESSSSSSRWYEIPHLIILNVTRTTLSSSSSVASSSVFPHVITYHGLQHVQQYGIDAIPYWTSLGT
jgi:hypothetical protein